LNAYNEKVDLSVEQYVYQLELKFSNTLKQQVVGEGVGLLPPLGNILLVVVILDFYLILIILGQLFRSKFFFHQNSSFFFYK
jgi:hypothetical protein